MIKLLSLPAPSHPVDLVYRKEVEPLSDPKFNPGQTSRSNVFAFNIAVDILGFVEYIDFVPGTSVCVHNEFHISFIPSHSLS